VERVAATNHFLVTEFCEHGGHVGFVEGASPFHSRYYVDRRVGEFFAARFESTRTLPVVPPPAD
jgi:predicted alpha/beta-fold hydrolase